MAWGTRLLPGCFIAVRSIFFHPSTLQVKFRGFELRFEILGNDNNLDMQGVN